MPLALPVETELLQYISLSRVLTRRVLEFSVQDGVLDVIDTMGRFSIPEFLLSLEEKLGYQLSEEPRQRMVTVLLDFLCEVGIVEQGQGDVYICRDSESHIEGLDIYSDASLFAEDRRIVETIHKQQLDFFTLCIERAPGFLRGGGFVCSFAEESSSVWDVFLGNHQFRSLRKILLCLMGVEDRPDYRILDLCYGPGHGISDILTWYPQVELLATDFTSSYARGITSHTNSHERSVIINHNWRGFGAPLPYDSGSFNAVHFTFADPYIPAGIRESLYREIFRVLKAGGVLGILGWGYPDREKAVIADRWVRLQILAHDFAESVCEGWQGFYDIGASQSLFSRIGFTEGAHVFQEDAILTSALRVLEKAR